MNSMLAYFLLLLAVSVVAGGLSAPFFWGIYESAIFCLSSHVPSGMCCGVFARSPEVREV